MQTADCLLPTYFFFKTRESSRVGYLWYPRPRRRDSTHPTPYPAKRDYNVLPTPAGRP
jgi:hypothetical protein